MTTTAPESSSAVTRIIFDSDDRKEKGDKPSVADHEPQPELQRQPIAATEEARTIDEAKKLVGHEEEPSFETKRDLLLKAIELDKKDAVAVHRLVLLYNINKLWHLSLSIAFDPSIQASSMLLFDELGLACFNLKLFNLSAVYFSRAFRESKYQDRRILSNLCYAEKMIIPPAVFYQNLTDLRTVVINLRSQAHRKEQMIKNVTGRFKDLTFFEGIDSVRPIDTLGLDSIFTLRHYRSCAQSHIEVLEKTILKDGKPVLIFEDDVNETEWFTSVFPVPYGVDCFYVGMNLNSDTIPIGMGLSKILNVWSLHATIYYSQDYARAFIKEARKACFTKATNIDTASFVLAKDWNCYGLNRPIYKQVLPYCGAEIYDRTTSYPPTYVMFPHDVKCDP